VKLVRFEADGVEGTGILHGDRIEITAELGGESTKEFVARAHARMLCPVRPSKIVCCGRNYPRHAAEMGGTPPKEPRLFLKAPSALIGPNDSIELPGRVQRIDPEGELGVVIGRRLRHATIEDVAEGVLGYTIVNDVTARDFQDVDRVYGRAKGFDTFCPCGPWVETDLDPNNLLVQTWVDGELRAEGRTSEMTFSAMALVAFISTIMTLEPGDLISTGTPPGVAPLRPGSLVSVRVEGIGQLDNPVVSAPLRR
jgi:2-keto-4-pentenoate hydratase/2-oxohepta-3-ene-1,7-dioic acid hydratase in catechol pathway